MTAKKRMANYELLRILAMLMVVTMHYLSNADSLPMLDAPLTGQRILGAGLESLCIVAVNVYILISGFFGVNSEFKLSRGIRLICQLWFYGLGIFAVLTLLGLPTAAGRDGVYGLIQYLFPIETDHYWFASLYILLYLLSPVMNAGMRGLSRRQTEVMLAGALLLFSVTKSVVPLPFANDRYGYDLGWFICVYLVGAYIGRFGIPFLEKGKRALLLYLGSCLGIFALTWGLYSVYGATGALAYYFTVPFHYNFILCLLGAVGLFYAFSRLELRESGRTRLLRTVGPQSFGVYLLHEHIDIRDIWYEASVRAYGGMLKIGIFGFLLHLLITVAVVFAAGILVDGIRAKSFALFSKRRSN